MNSLLVPYVTEKTPQGERTTDVFSRLLRNRIIFLGTPIDDQVANVVMAQLLHLESEDDTADIALYINSPGGSFTAMTAIYDTMMFIKPDVQTLCMGQAASAAASLLAAGTPGKRLALPHSRILIHQPSGESQGQASDLFIQAQEIERMRDELETLLAHHTNKDINEIRKDLDRDKILTAQGALDYGIIDAIVTSRKN